MMSGPDGLPEDDDIARMLRGAGSRDRPASALEAQIRATVEAEWREVVAARRRQRRVGLWAAAAGVALAAVAVWLAVPLLGGGTSVGTLLSASGSVEHRSSLLSGWEPLAPGSAIRRADEIRTTGDSHAVLTLGPGITLRLDQASRFAVERDGRTVLTDGAAYVDLGSRPTPETAAFALQTPGGTVHHLGTQYEARIDGRRLLVAVREGRVRIDTPSGPVSGVAGEQITLDGGRVTRRELAAHDARWNWVVALAPSYRIEGSTLLDFLSWAARETGRELIAAPAVRLEASSIVLHGSVEGLSPDESIAAVRGTTGLAIELEPGRILLQPGGPASASSLL
jgi:ferric-dicitrate binding protein FerR (iron transport regulator)